MCRAPAPLLPTAIAGYRFHYPGSRYPLRTWTFAPSAQAFIDWCEEHGSEILYIQPGKPNQNAFIERFNKSYREEVLSAHLFSTLDQVREISEKWMITYNEYRPHDALGRMPPAMFVRKLKLENSSLELST